MIKNTLLLLFSLLFTILLQAQNNALNDTVVITSKHKKTKIGTNKKGQLVVNVSPKNILKFKTIGFVTYSDFGAKGNGKTDDLEAISATHAFANEQQLYVKADKDATYYIGGKNRTAIIKTNTDFGTATFIIDDTDVKNKKAPIFKVASSHKPFKLKGISSLKKNQKKIDISLPGKTLITVTDVSKKHYIRLGLNPNKGASKTDIFIVDKDGNVDMSVPIIWGFNEISNVTGLLLDDKTLTITGGKFTTIANKHKSEYKYYARNITIERSNVIVDGLKHYVENEGLNGAPYGGFLAIKNCAYVTVKNTVLTGHKIYKTIGSAKKSVSMGTYDLLINRALNVSFINCTQTNDINNKKYWGIMGSNFCKNLLYDGCKLSRFDAHQGVYNATVRNSTLGHSGITAIGSGTLTLENSTIRGRYLVNLRRDYGSSWEGELIIRNCTFIPSNGKRSNAPLITGLNSGLHDFGYVCYMPERIIIENLTIDDSNHHKNYNGLAILGDINPEMTNNSYKELFPYVKTKEIILKNITTKSGKNLRVSNNMFLFKDVNIIKD